MRVVGSKWRTGISNFQVQQDLHLEGPPTGRKLQQSNQIWDPTLNGARTAALVERWKSGKIAWCNDWKLKHFFWGHLFLQPVWQQVSRYCLPEESHHELTCSSKQLLYCHLKSAHPGSALFFFSVRKNSDVTCFVSSHCSLRKPLMAKYSYHMFFASNRDSCSLLSSV